jgi:hypothetical protein
LIFSSLIRHQRLLARFDLFFSGLASDAFSLNDPLMDFMLLGRGVDADVGDEEAFWEGSSRGAEVGAIAGETFEERDWDENDLVEGESSVGVAGIGDPRPAPLGRLTVDIRGLCTADGFGVLCMLYTPSVPNEWGVEYGMCWTWRRNDS